MDICIIGIGYVGLVTGACFAELGLNVTCIDNDKSKIQRLKLGQVPIYEPGLKELVAKNLREGRLCFTNSLSNGIDQALVIFIAVGTPESNDGSPDLTYVLEVAKAIGQAMHDYKVVVIKSTVPVGASQKIVQAIKDNQSKPINFDIVSNPEFLREGSAIEDFMRPNRVIIGAITDQAKAIMKDLYAPLYLIETPFVITSIETAEMIKYASNAFLATKISFINEIANICELVKADVNEVAKGMGLDQRIGPKFLHAGPGFGGSCFPKDISAIAKLAKEKGYAFRIIDAVIEVNRNQRLRMVKKIQEALGWSIRDKILGILGLTFKPNTDDMRDAPSLDILPPLLKAGAKVRVFDPAGIQEAIKLIPALIYCKNVYEAILGADALILITEWNQFRNLDWVRVRKNMKGRTIIDLRNVYKPERVLREGFVYFGVGRN